MLTLHGKCGKMMVQNVRWLVSPTINPPRFAVAWVTRQPPLQGVRQPPPLVDLSRPLQPRGAAVSFFKLLIPSIARDILLALRVMRRWIKSWLTPHPTPMKQTALPPLTPQTQALGRSRRRGPVGRHRPFLLRR